MAAARLADEVDRPAAVAKAGMAAALPTLLPPIKRP